MKKETGRRALLLMLGIVTFVVVGSSVSAQSGSARAEGIIEQEASGIEPFGIGPGDGEGGPPGPGDPGPGGPGEGGPGLVGGDDETHKKIDQDNMLQSSNVKVSIKDYFPDTTIRKGASRDKRVKVSNEGKAAVFLRVAYVETWRDDEDEDWYYWLYDDGNRVEKIWPNHWDDEWIDGQDGWFYYKKVLPAGSTTKEFISSIRFADDLEPIYENGVYDLHFYAEALQLSDEAAVNTAATEKVFDKIGVLENAVVEKGAVISGTVSWQ